MTRGQLLTIPDTNSDRTQSKAPSLAKTVMKKTNELPVGNKVIAEIEYEAITPVMIGDFEGMHYRIIEDVDNGELKAFITGTPTAKAIIGKARWLARVAIATALNLKDHREAERAGIKCKNKIKSLIGILFGDTKSNGKGVVTIKLEQLASTVINNINRSGNQVPITEYNKLRGELSIEKFYNTNNANDDFFKIKNNKYDVQSPNRFNALIVPSSHDIYQINSTYTIVPTIWEYGKDEKGYAYHIEPLKQNLIKFKLKIFIDEKRLTYILTKECNYTTLETVEIIEKIKNYLALLLGAVPIILGLGKASSRGFGHFKIKNVNLNEKLNLIKKLSVIENETTVNEIKKDYFDYFLELISILKSININIKNINRGKLQTVPRLPDNRLIYITNANYSNHLEIINKISKAVIKKTWKTFMKIPETDTGYYIHTWLLGLPRKGTIPNRRGRINTGYGLRYTGPNYNNCYVNISFNNYINVEQNRINFNIRRQSPILSVPIIYKNNYKLVNLLFYSNDLYKLLEMNNERHLIHVGFHDDYNIFKITFLKINNDCYIPNLNFYRDLINLIFNIYNELLER